MCDCIRSTTEKLRSRIKENIEEKYNVHSWEAEGDFSNLAFPLNGGANKVYMPFSASYIKKKKDGSPEKRETNYSVNMYATFCPFCGEKYPE